ncbi:hypothetical protein [Haloarcula sediminis]|uniref:hypothetical protein n=1 Tax=Haloarcula sediminis TaxID=3111777 RepID=UPI002D79E5BD|nr:hypothetical protein [Haloarcula sp. CK38]
MYRAITSLLLVAVLMTAAVSPAAAQSDDGPFFDGLVAEDDSGGFWQGVGTQIAEATGSISRWAEARTGDDDADANEHAREFAREYNAHNETIEAYANDRLTADTDHDVFALNFTDRDDGNATVYLVSTVSDGNYTESEVLDEAAFDKRNRTVDQTVSFDWYQSRNAEDELETFVDDYAEPNEDITNSYRAKMLAKYGPPESSMWNATSE